MRRASVTASSVLADSLNQPRGQGGARVESQAEGNEGEDVGHRAEQAEDDHEGADGSQVPGAWPSGLPGVGAARPTTRLGWRVRPAGPAGFAPQAAIAALARGARAWLRAAGDHLGGQLLDVMAGAQLADRCVKRACRAGDQLSELLLVVLVAGGGD